MTTTTNPGALALAMDALLKAEAKECYAAGMWESGDSVNSMALRAMRRCTRAAKAAVNAHFKQTGASK